MSQSKNWHLLARDTSNERVEAWDEMLLGIVESISLPESLYNRLEGHYDAIGELLTDPVDQELSDLLIFPQGSVLTRTLVRPLSGNDADVDAVAFRPQGTRLSPREWMDRLHSELEARAKTQGTVVRKKRCVTVTYADDTLPAHVDVTLAVPSECNAKRDGSGHLEVPDYPSNRPHPTNPKDFAHWITETIQHFPLPLALTTIRLVEARAKADVQPLPDHHEMVALDPLRLSIKLCKRHRDLYARRNHCEDVQPLSVVLTTLVVKAYRAVVQQLTSQNQRVTMIDALRQIVTRMPLEFEQTGTGVWELQNPRRPEENFAEKWRSEPRYATTFMAWHSELKNSIELGLLNFSDRQIFESAVEESFGSEPRREAARRLTEAAKSGKTMPGISGDAAIHLQRGERALAALGLAASNPLRSQEPPKLQRLG